MRMELSSPQPFQGLRLIATIARVSALTWGSLGFFLFVLVAGSSTVGGIGWGFWRQLQATLDSSSAAVGDLATSMEALDAKVRRVEGGTAELQGAAARLSRSGTRARILLASAQESREVIAGWLQSLPRA